MAVFEVTATALVYVGATISAETEEEAKQKFSDQICLNGALTDTPEGDYCIDDDTIAELTIKTVERVDDP